MSSLLPILIIVFLYIFLGSGKKKKTADTSKKETPVQQRPQVFDKIPRAAEFSEKLERRSSMPAPERTFYDSDCMDWDTQHDHDRRMEQLDNFLANGIISRREYNILVGHFEQNR